MGGVCSAVKKLSAAHLGIQEEWDGIIIYGWGV
jgi:hypothetical protein